MVGLHSITPLRNKSDDKYLTHDKAGHDTPTFCVMLSWSTCPLPLSSPSLPSISALSPPPSLSQFLCPPPPTSPLHFSLIHTHINRSELWGPTSGVLLKLVAGQSDTGQVGQTGQQPLLKQHTMTTGISIITVTSNTTTVPNTHSCHCTDESLREHTKKRNTEVTHFI